MSRKRQRLLFGIGSGVAAVALILIASLSHAAIARQLHTWKLLPEPERLTELYFTDHKHLPMVYSPGQVQTVAFTIHNLEYRTTTYTYHVVQTDSTGAQSSELASGMATLGQDKKAQLSTPVTLANMGLHSQITILLNTGESIDYLLTGEGV